MRIKGGYVYIVTNQNKNVLYVGVTSHLACRIKDHRKGHGSIFTKKYNCFYPVYYTFFEFIEEAIEHEKKLKKWKRVWKEQLITDFNPSWEDLYEKILDLD